MLNFTHRTRPKSWKCIGHCVGRDGDEDISYYKCGQTRIEVDYNKNNITKIPYYYEKYQRI